RSDLRSIGRALRRDHTGTGTRAAIEFSRLSGAAHESGAADRRAFDRKQRNTRRDRRNRDYCCDPGVAQCDLCRDGRCAAAHADRQKALGEARVIDRSEANMSSTESNALAHKSTGYYPWWLDNLADDCTGEGAAMQGVLHGAEAVHELVTEARKHMRTSRFSLPATMAIMAFSRSTRARSKASPRASS